MPRIEMYQPSPTPPDAHQVGPERYRAPECLFHPEQMGSEAMGVQDCLLKGIMRTDMDMRRTLFGQVVLSGGSTLFPGFGDRLLNEVGGGRVAVICVRVILIFSSSANGFDVRAVQCLESDASNTTSTFLCGPLLLLSENADVVSCVCRREIEK